jgi:hypothetical protein
MQVVVVALEDGCAEVNLHVEVARRATIDAMFAFAGQPDTITFVDAGRES